MLDQIQSCETRFKQEGTLLQTAHFEPALTTNSGLAGTQVAKRHAIFESLERSRAQLRQVFSGDPRLNIEVSRTNAFSQRIQQQRPLEYLWRLKESKLR